MSGLRKRGIRFYLYAVTTINLQDIKTLRIHEQCFVQSIEMYSATSWGNEYVYVRVRINGAASMENLHLFVIWFPELHTAVTLLVVNEDPLRGLSGIGWCKRLLFIATDGAANVAGHFQDTVTRFEQMELPGIFWIWCNAHWIDLTVQYVVSRVVKESFCGSVVGLMSYFSTRSGKSPSWNE